MTVTNSTTVEKQFETFQQLRCSAAWSTGIHGPLNYLSALNIFLSIIAVLGNTLILVALRKVSSLNPSSKLLFRCLATTDLCVGLITEPLNVVYWMSVAQEEWKLCRYTLASLVIAGYTLCSVSLLTVTAISVDRLLALFLALRYRQVVSLRRTYVIVAIVWITSAIASVFYLFNPVITAWYGRIITPVCLVTSIASYAKIFLKLRHHQIQILRHDQQEPEEQPSRMNPLSIERYRKAVSSALWVQCTLIACYLPFSVVRALVTYSRNVSRSVLIFELATTLIYLNSSLNPVLYCWKISEVKNAVKETIREALCCF